MGKQKSPQARMGEPSQSVNCTGYISESVQRANNPSPPIMNSTYRISRRHGAGEAEDGTMKSGIIGTGRA